MIFSGMPHVSLFNSAHKFPSMVSKSMDVWVFTINEILEAGVGLKSGLGSVNIGVVKFLNLSMGSVVPGIRNVDHDIFMAFFFMSVFVVGTADFIVDRDTESVSF